MEPLVVEGGWTPTGRGWTGKKKTQKKGGCGGGVELIRTVKLRLWPEDRETEEKLLRLCTISMKLWDELNHERRKLWKEGKLDSEGMKRTAKEFYERYKGLIGARTAAAVIWKNDEAWRAFFALLEAKKKGRLPLSMKVRPPGVKRKRRRKLWAVVRKDQYEFEGEVVIIKSLGSIGTIRVRYSGLIHVRGERGRAELHYDPDRGRWYMHATFRVSEKLEEDMWVKVPLEPKGNLHAGLDLGVNNLLAVYVENGEALLVNGRQLKSESFYWQRNTSKYQSKLSWHGLKTSRQLRLMHAKERLRRRNYIDWAVRNAIEWLYGKGVAVIVVGYPKYAAAEPGKNAKVNFEITSVWSYHLLIRRITEVAQEYGINVIVVDEAYTSSTCPLCGTSNDGKHERIERGLFKCFVHNIVFNADLVGAFNILRRLRPDVKPNIAALTGARVTRLKR